MIEEQEILFDYEGTSGNLFVNPDSTIEEQVEELVRQYYESKGLDFDELKVMELDESALQSKHTVQKFTKTFLSQKKALSILGLFFIELCKCSIFCIFDAVAAFDIKLLSLFL